MSGQCCSPQTTSPAPGFRKALWFALWVNLGMFLLEGLASLQSGSVALMADAIDFFGDSANYLLSLSVLSMGMLWRGRAAWIKGLSMTLFGIAVLGRAAWALHNGAVPQPLTMGVIGMLALAANAIVALVLFRFRAGDADMRSVWLCSRNDAIGNIAVLAAAIGVFGTSAAWPDLIVASIMGGLAITSGVSILRHAGHDIKLARQSVRNSSDRKPATPQGY